MGLLTFAAAWFAVAVVQAQAVWYVDKNAPGPVRDGRSWVTAFVTLDSALHIAFEGDTIRVAQGRYTPDASGLAHPREATFNLPPAVVVEGGYAGAGSPEPDLRDPTLHKTTLSGDLNNDDDSDGDNSDNCYHVVTALIGIDGPTLDGFSITGGNADDTGFPTGNGVGGGLYTSGPITVTDCEIFGNAANQGGGMFNLEGSPVLIRCVFRGNRALHGAGLMLYGYEHRQYRGKRTGGGPRHGTPRLTDCLFTQNHAADTAGAIWASGALEDPTLVNCVLTLNSAANDAGAVYASGGFHVFENCLLTRNTAGRNGGMMWTDGIVSITHSTIADNQASLGGGVFAPGAGPSLANCALWGNRDDSGVGESAQIASRFPPLASHCCVQGWTGTWGGQHNFWTDPSFVPGPIGDYYLSHLATGQAIDSPCIDAGNTTVELAGMQTLSTRRDEAPDVGTVDVGHHYPATATGFVQSDSDRDTDVDLADAAQFQRCFSGVLQGVPPWCRIFDTALDGDVDLDDLYPFTNAMTGP